MSLTGLQGLNSLALSHAVPESLLSQTAQLLDDTRLRSIDVQLARQLLQWEQQAAASMASVADLSRLTHLFVQGLMLSWALGRGQVCLPLQHCPLPELRSWWPRASDYDDNIRCIWTADNSAADTTNGWKGQPLVLERQSGKPVRLYLARYYFYQQFVERAIRARVGSSTNIGAVNNTLIPATTDCRSDCAGSAESALSASQMAALGQSLRLLFPRSENAPALVNAEPDWQAVAAATACLQKFCVITGGPGTGKTTTVTRLLCALLGLQPGLSIALAAPTGKAAARMLESIRQSRSSDLPFAEQIPDESFTLHRLLGWTPGGFRYGPDRPLPYDCVVVDEASMVDLAMMQQLLSALSPQARLILLGDKDQLASVEAGSVLADLCNSGGGYGLTAAFAARLQQLLGDDLSAWISDDISPMQNAVAQLRFSRRFDASSGIGQLAAAVNRGDSRGGLACFEQFADIQLDSGYKLPADRPRRALLPWQQQVVAGYEDYCEQLQKAGCRAGETAGAAMDVSAARAILQTFGRFRVLVAVRQGSQGAELINRQIEDLLSAKGALQRQSGSPWYIGRPVMVTRNDYDLGLFNGDIGILLPDPQGEPRVAFETSHGDIRYYLPGRLPSHETSFAMTVHKSQGSEFSRVMLLLPERWQPVVTRELIYTAITRARSHFYLLGSRDCWQRGVATRVERASGLCDALWSVSDT
jgi:exodeoxyribonuclease V alpha subunit